MILKSWFLNIYNDVSAAVRFPYERWSQIWFRTVSFHSFHEFKRIVCDDGRTCSHNLWESTVLIRFFGNFIIFPTIFWDSIRNRTCSHILILLLSKAHMYQDVLIYKEINSRGDVRYIWMHTNYSKTTSVCFMIVQRTVRDYMFLDTLDSYRKEMAEVRFCFFFSMHLD